MKLRELKEKLNGLDPKYDDREVLKAVPTTKHYVGEIITKVFHTECLLNLGNEGVKFIPPADEIDKYEKVIIF